ncbi:MAG: uridine kinase [Candidatus Eisenbacteria bacterium]|uniref:Uridine kinase n=1 Tax=Eiseniibacteriota bacterium TaxID=2212470 RepID=A0A948RYM4_UNCEI|nr:uridine kinase [Candidatus Eisenbacteria bacterium]MBU1947953.1 uridine kinase [Candidatus Eisenbacteria bacterium]MBU2693423.1 uridine kinase [Candidatus Eisenbacteria bacterium]
MARRILIGIAGGTASGKTLVAQRLDDELGSKKVRILKLDSYYRDISHLSKGERSRQNFDHPDAFEMSLLREHLKILLEGGKVQVPVYDFSKHMRLKNTVVAGGEQIFILEGILVLEDPFLRQLMDIRVFIDADADIRLLRRIRRDVKLRGRTITSILDQYEQSVRPMYMQFIDPSKRYADIIVPGGGMNEVAIDLLKVKIQSLLAQGEAEERAARAKQSANKKKKKKKNPPAGAEKSNRRPAS